MWYLPRSVRFLLYEDELTGAQNEALTDSIRSVVHAASATGHAAKSGLTQWAAVYRLVAHRAATTVERAAKDIALCQGSPGLPRRIDRLDRGGDAGAHLSDRKRQAMDSIQGENLFQWHHVYRNAPKQWISMVHPVRADMVAMRSHRIDMRSKI
ncbi:hypothetical protein GGP69_001355 [Salinibacter ruber]|nr:hypothetical protein [Salinibacter ruber]